MTGVRVGDVLRLKRGSIVVEDYKGKNVLRLNIIGKGSKQAVMYIHDEVARDIILDYITTEFHHDEYL